MEPGQSTKVISVSAYYFESPIYTGQVACVKLDTIISGPYSLINICIICVAGNTCVGYILRFYITVSSLSTSSVKAVELPFVQ